MTGKLTRFIRHSKRPRAKPTLYALVEEELESENIGRARQCQDCCLDHYIKASYSSCLSLTQILFIKLQLLLQG